MMKALRLGRSEEGELGAMAVEVWMQGWQNILLNWWRWCNCSCRASNRKGLGRDGSPPMYWTAFALRTSPSVGGGTVSGKERGVRALEPTFQPTLQSVTFTAKLELLDLTHVVIITAFWISLPRKLVVAKGLTW